MICHNGKYNGAIRMLNACDHPDSRQRQTARRFVEYWTFRRGSEKGEDQQFWNSLLGEVLGMEDVKSHVQYQVPSA